MAVYQDDRGGQAVLTAVERELLQGFGAEHRLWPAATEPVVLARGSENTTFALGDLIVRIGSDGDAVAREAAVLDGLARATRVRVPVPLVHDARRAILVYRKLTGVPLLRSARPAQAGAAEVLADLLAALRALPQSASLPLDVYPHASWLDEARQHHLAVRDHLAAHQRAVIERFLNEHPPSDRDAVVPQHNDLGAEHILVDEGGAVVGVIDWTDAARADPARDLGLLFRDLGEAVAFRVAELLDGPPSADVRARIRFLARCKWLEDASYALLAPGGREAYVANIGRTFEGTFRGLA